MQAVVLALISVLGVPFLVWLARQASALYGAHWPHGNAAWWFFAVFGIGSIVLGDLTGIGHLVEPSGPLAYFGSTWLTNLETIGLQFCLSTWIAAYVWLRLLMILYPIDDARRPLSFTDVISKVLSIAIPVGLNAAWVAQIAGSLLVTLAVGISTCFIAFVFAWLILRRVAHQRVVDR